MERIAETNTNDLADEHFIAITLPRMSYEIVGMQYDPERQLPKMNSCVFAGADGNSNTRARIYTKTPYNIQFQLNVYGKTHDDCLQIVEQIIPYFAPSYTLRIKPLPDFPSIVDNIPLTLTSIGFTDDFEGAEEQRRTIIYTLDFEMKIDFYGPTVEGNIIRTADISFFLDDDSDAAGWSWYSTLSVTTDPADANPDSDYSFVETWTFAGEGDSDST